MSADERHTGSEKRSAFAFVERDGTSTSNPSQCHSKIESTVRYFGIEVDDAIEITEKIDI